MNEQDPSSENASEGQDAEEQRENTNTEESDEPSRKSTGERGDKRSSDGGDTGKDRTVEAVPDDPMYNIFDLSGTEWTCFFLILTGAVLVRVLYMVEVWDEVLFHEPILDGSKYVEQARIWLSEGIHTGTYGVEGFPDYLPLYPLFLTGIFSLFGESLVAVVVVQTLLGLLTGMVIFFLGNYLFESPVGFIAMGLLLLFPEWILFESRLSTAIPFCFFVTGGLFFLVGGLSDTRHPHYDYLFLSGLCFAIGLLLNVMILLPVVLLGFWIFVAVRWDCFSRLMAVMGWLVPILLASSGLVGLNHTKLQQEYDRGGVLLQHNLARQAYFGNTGEGDSGLTPVPAGIQFQQQVEEPKREQITHPVDQELYFLEKTYDYITSYPRAYLSLVWRKATYIVSSLLLPATEPITELRDHSVLLTYLFLALPFGILFAAGVLGSIFVCRERGLSFGLNVLLTGLFLLLLLFSVSSYTRLPLLIPLSLLAGYGLYGVGIYIGLERSWGRGSLSIVLLVTLLWFSLNTRMEESILEDRFPAYEYEARMHAKADNYRAAVQSLSEGSWGERLSSRYRMALYLHSLETRNPEALEDLEAGKGLDPVVLLEGLLEEIDSEDLTFSEPFDLRGQIALENNNYDRAYSAYRSAIEREPTEHRRIQFARAALNEGNYEEVVREMDQALEENAQCYPCLTLKADALYQQGQYEKARPLVENVIDGASPDQMGEWISRSLLMLGNIHLQADRTEKAREAFFRAQDGFNTEWAEKANEQLNELLQD